MEATVCTVRGDHGDGDTLIPNLAVQERISECRTKRRGSVILLLLIAACCAAAVWCLGLREFRQPFGATNVVTLSDAEESRPQHYQSAFHFQPTKNWMNGTELGSINSYNFLSNACLRQIVVIESWNATLVGFLILD